MSVFDNLSAEDKYLIRMYTTARQFRDAITPNEYLQFRNGQIRNRVYPYVVNRAFSCELYLKMILCHAGKPYKSGHSILQLLAQAEAKELFMDWVLNTKLKGDTRYTVKELETGLASISDAFTKVRYIYEQETLNVAVGVLDALSDYLDERCRQVIMDKHGIDMRKHTFI